MAAEDSTDTRVTVATLRGEMREGFAEIKGQLAAVIESMSHRDKDDAELRQRVTTLEVKVSDLREWQIAVSATEAASPRLTWGAFFRDAKTWVLAILTIAALIYGFIQ